MSNMIDALSRRDFLAMSGTLGAGTIGRQRLAQLLRKPLHLEIGTVVTTPSVIRGNARFQILSPTLLRMEYAPNGQFIDAPSVAVVKRDWPTTSYTAHDVDGWVEIETSGMRLKYKLGADQFTPETLIITWKDGKGGRAWTVGDVDDKNLGGVPYEHITWRSAPGDEKGPLSRNGYFVLDDSGTAIWNAKTEWPEARPDQENRQDFYFFVYGDDYARFLREATQLMGSIPMVPRYILGTWFGSRAGYSTDEWKRIVHRFQDEGIPIDLIVIDSLTSAIITWSGFGFDPEQMPNPKEFFAWLKARGVKATVNEHYNAMTPESDANFDKVRVALKLPPDTTSIEHDLGNKYYAERLFMDMLHKPALDDGMAFWWQDGFAKETTIPGLDPLLWTRHVEYTGQERITKKRAFVFCRLGMWGSHRYGSFFTGDLIPYWTTLDLLVPFNVQAGNSLVPYVANLTGGVYQETLDPELYQRWVQFSAFSPIFWWHGMWGLRLPWEYGTAVMQNVKEFLTLRYRLIPYMYTHTRLAHETGMPLVRGTYFHYPEQERAYTFHQQYLFGADLLVAPITHPGAGRPVMKEVYLPDGDMWYDYFTETIYSGGQVLSYECPLDRIPLFVRAGAILPLAIDAPSSDAQPVTEALTINIYSGDKPSTFRLYEDDGLSLDYREHQYAWTPITYTPSADDTHRITIGPAEGHYSGQPTARPYRIRIHGTAQPKHVTVGNRTLTQRLPSSTAHGWSWSNSTRVLEINLVQPIAANERVTVMLAQAGKFRDQVVAQQARIYRERVRRIKIEEKLRWAMLLAMHELHKEPHVLQITYQIEQELNDLIDNPSIAATHPPDFQQMTAAILAAFVTTPFDSTRKIPEHEEEGTKTARSLAGQTFTPEQLHRMTADLLDCRLVATATVNPSADFQSSPTGVVRARVVYDTHCIATVPVVNYELILPDTGLPGWGEMKRSFLPDDASAEYEVRAPFQLQPGTYLCKLRATVRWGANETVLTSDVPWVVLPVPSLPAKP